MPEFEFEFDEFCDDLSGVVDFEGAGAGRC
jgi:hypothetical protein